MTTDKLRHQLERRGYGVRIDTWPEAPFHRTLYVLNRPQGDVMATVNLDHGYVMTTVNPLWKALPETERRILFHLLSDHARTPVPEREAETAYRLRLRHVAGPRRYVNYDVISHDITIDTEYEDGDFRTRFTDAYVEANAALDDFMAEYEGLLETEVVVDAQPVKGVDR